MHTQHEKILFAMQKHPDRLYRVSDFSGIPNEFNDQVGYKASSRMSELAQKGYVEVAGTYKKRLLYYRITPKGLTTQTLRKIMNESRKEKKNLLRRATEWLFS